MAIEGSAERMAMLAAIIESSEDAIISKNIHGIITSWNKSAENIFGYTEQEAIGKHISLIVPPDRMGEEEIIISKLKRGEKIEHYETIRLTKEGNKLNISLSISPIRNARGDIIGASKIARDITKQKKAELLIRQYVHHLEEINSTGKALSSELDIDAILQKTTDAATSISGAAFGAFFYNKTDKDGKSYFLYTLSGAPREAFERFGMPRNTPLFDTTFSGKGTVRSDDIRKHPNYGRNSPHKGMPTGHLPVVSYLAVPVFSPMGIVIGGLFFGHPEPGKFKHEHELVVEAIASQAAIALGNAKLYQEVRALNETKDQFIGFASHELKTPLTTMSGYIQLMEKLPEKTSQLLPKVNKQLSRLSAIISDLLDISKIQAGKFELSKSKIALNNLIRDSVESARQLSDLHQIEYSLPDAPIMLNVDVVKMTQVIVNIVSNAIKYSSATSKIQINAEQLADDVRISIKDYGIGIPKEDLENIFIQFYRIASDNVKAEGLGLGLYLCKQFVEAHHGTIWAESDFGHGTTVHISLPVTVN
jgi:PAS domain S-box-containing protein